MLLRSAQQQRTEMTAVDGQLCNYSEVLERLETEADLGSLERALDRDRQVVTYLIEHAAGLELASIENKLLIFDYKLMRIWYRLTRTLAPQQARKALWEMASVLDVLFAHVGERSQIQMEA